MWERALTSKYAYLSLLLYWQLSSFDIFLLCIIAYNERC